MDKQTPTHLLDGATLGTEDRGDIVIRSKAGDLLWRFVPMASRQDQPLLEAIRVSQWNALNFAKARSAKVPESPAHQAQQLLLRMQELVKDMQKSFDNMQQDQGRALLCTLEDAKDLARDARAIVVALSVPVDGVNIIPT